MSTPSTPDPQPTPIPPSAQSVQPPSTPPPSVGIEGERPDGVTEEEWQALGDPGKAALVRERTARAAAERELARRHDQPPVQQPPADPPGPPVGDGTPGTPDIAALIRDAVAQAVRPMVDQASQREATEAAERIRDAVTNAARGRLHDPTDALAHIDLTGVTDGNGQANTTAIATAIEDLLARKPHLGQVIDPRRRADPATGLGSGTGGAAAPLDDRVKATLARMQSAAGVRSA